MQDFQGFAEDAFDVRASSTASDASISTVGGHVPGMRSSGTGGSTYPGKSVLCQRHGARALLQRAGLTAVPAW
ncbi:protein of unknown function [Burkholderia multivorans]